MAEETKPVDKGHETMNKNDILINMLTEYIPTLSKVAHLDGYYAANQALKIIEQMADMTDSNVAKVIQEAHAALSNSLRAIGQNAGYSAPRA